MSVAALAISMSACATETTKTESGVKVVKEGKLTVCTSLPYEPFEFQKDKKIVGFDIDLMDKVAEANDLTVTVEVTAFEGIQTGQSLNTGQCDAAAAGMTITDERAKVIDFSDRYFEATQALLTKNKSYDSLESLAGKKIGVQSGTTGQKYTEKNAPKDAELIVFENLGLETTAVKTGQVDARVQDNGPLRQRQEEPRHVRDRGVRHRRAVRLRGQEGRQRRAARVDQRGDRRLPVQR